MPVVVVLKRIKMEEIRKWLKRAAEELSDDEASEYDSEEEFEGESETEATEKRSGSSEHYEKIKGGENPSILVPEVSFISAPLLPEIVEDFDPPVLFERGEEEKVGRREPEDMGRLEAPAAPVLIEDDAPAMEEVNGIGMADIEAVIDSFADDEGYVSGYNWSFYKPEEEERMIFGNISSDSSDSSDSEYVP
nr:MAG: hypothetical protein [Hemigrapsus takanoi nimavirus]